MPTLHITTTDGRISSYQLLKQETTIGRSKENDIVLLDQSVSRKPSLEDHPFRGQEVLAAEGYPEWLRRAILAHAPHTGVAPETDLERCLFASDELCGLLTACALVTPSNSLHELKVESVRKRMKDKAFARSVSRDDIVKGAEGIAMDLDAHIGFVIEALRAVAADLGLEGRA